MNFYDVLFNRKYGRKRGGFIDQIFSAGEPTPPEPHNYLYKWDFTKNVNPLIDEVKGLEMILGNGATVNTDGIIFDAPLEYAGCEICDFRGKTIEVDMGTVDFKGNATSSDTIQFITTPKYDTSANNNRRGYTLLAFKIAQNGWSSWGSTIYDSNSSWKYSSTQYINGTDLNTINIFSNKNIKLVVSEFGNEVKLYLDDVYMGHATGIYAVNSLNELRFGNANYTTTNEEARYYDITIKTLKIYENDEKPYNWDLTKSLIDSGNNVTINISGAVQSQNGLLFDSSRDYAQIPIPFDKRYIYEFDIASMNWQGSDDEHGRLILPNTESGFIWRKQTKKWELYQNQWYADDSSSTYVTDSDIFSGKTLKMLWDNNNKLCVYADDVLVYRCPLSNALIGLSQTFMIGSSNAQSYFGMDITGIRIYKNANS